HSAGPAVFVLKKMQVKRPLGGRITVPDYVCNRSFVSIHTETRLLSRSPSEHHLQHELKNAGISRPGNLAETRCADGGSRAVEVDVVEYVEELRAELQLHTVREVGVLDYAEVRIEGTQSPQDIPSGVAERTHRVGYESDVLKNRSTI